MKRPHLRFFLCLLLIFAALVPSARVSAESLTATITAYNKASLSGDVASAQVHYLQHQQTTYKSRLSMGDTAVMTITNMPNGVVDSVVLMMHSNKAAGAGSMQMTIDGRSVWTISDNPFNDAAWAGRWSSEYVAVSRAMKTALGDVDIHIIASANSLYWESVTIYYQPAAPEAYAVGLYTQSGDNRVLLLTEQSPGAGVTLPSIAPPNADWLHLGWSEQLISQQTDCPYYIKPGTRYYPQANTSLYAVYKLEPDWFAIEQDTMALSGEYMVVAAGSFGSIASGPVQNKQVQMTDCSLMLMEDSLYRLYVSCAPAEYRYNVDFNGDSAIICHTASKTYVGYQTTSSGGYLSQKNVAWKWTSAKNHSFCFYHHPTADGWARMLTPEGQTAADGSDLYTLVDLNQILAPAEIEYLLLFPTSGLPTAQANTYYSSYPQLTSLADVAQSTIDWDAEMSVYSADGRLLLSGLLVPDQLPRGVSIIRQQGVTQKIIR